MKASSLRTISLLFLTTITCGLVQAQPSAKSDLIVSSEQFSPNATVKAGDSRIAGPDSKIEEGEINGVHYRFYYSDGSGTFIGTKAGDFGSPGTALVARQSNWNVGCKKDAVSDAKMCHMYMKNLWVWAFQNGSFLISIGHDHFPGSTVTIRIDGGKPITTSAQNEGTFSRQASAKLVAQLKDASKVTIRYMEWPYRSWVDETWELYGFKESLQYVTWAVKRIR